MRRPGIASRGQRELYSPAARVPAVVHRFAQGLLESTRSHLRRPSGSSVIALAETTSISDQETAVSCARGGGGAEGNRTPDLCSAIAALSHLSYSPAPRPGIARERRH